MTMLLCRYPSGEGEADGTVGRGRIAGLYQSKRGDTAFEEVQAVLASCCISSLPEPLPPPVYTMKVLLFRACSDFS